MDQSRFYDPIRCSGNRELGPSDHRKGDVAANVAAYNIKRYVFKKLKYDFAAGFDQKRTAVQILKSGKGVCRDYAVLSAALMRAGKIPGSPRVRSCRSPRLRRGILLPRLDQRVLHGQQVARHGGHRTEPFIWEPVMSNWAPGTYADANGFEIQDNGNLLLTILPSEIPAAQPAHAAHQLP